MMRQASNWDLCVLRHAGTLEWLRANVEGFDSLPVLTGNVAEKDVKGKRVLGVLPLHLAAAAESVTEVVLDPPPRGEELTAAQVADRFQRFDDFVVLRPVHDLTARKGRR